MRRVTSFLTIFAAFAFLVGSEAQAEISDMAVVVKGMTCPFCTFGVQKKLNEVEGVRAVEVDLKTSTARLRLDEGAAPTPEEIFEAVRAAGFDPETIRVRVIGTLAVEGQRLIRDRYNQAAMVQEITRAAVAARAARQPPFRS